MVEWGDLRYLLAAARCGSTLAAAQDMGVSQATVSRRISALEAALQLKLFERLQSGSRLTAQGEVLLRTAEDVESAMRAFTERAQAERRELSGVIRFTMAPEGAEPVVAGPIASFMQRHPGLQIEMLLTERFLDVAAGEADVAVRAGPRPTDPNLIVRKVAEDQWAGYCTPAYLRAYGPVAGPADLARHKVIGVEGPLVHLPAMAWLAEHVTDFVCRVATLRALLGFAQSGAGIVLLPTAYARQGGGLVQCLEALPGISTKVWVVTRDDIRRTPHVRAFIDFISGHIGALHEPDAVEADVAPSSAAPGA
jgi:DNA-binding transcriptional LysR family regulator